jgi:hypothetical protein
MPNKIDYEIRVMWNNEVKIVEKGNGVCNKYAIAALPRFICTKHLFLYHQDVRSSASHRQYVRIAYAEISLRFLVF